MGQLIYLICEQEQVDKNFIYHIIFASTDKDVVSKKLVELLECYPVNRKYVFSSVMLDQGAYSYVGSNSYEDCVEGDN